MKKFLWLGKAGAILLLVGITLAAYMLYFRPYQLLWGATEGEIQRTLPGDELLEDPDFLATRAITIDAPRDEVWPWLIQMGHGRAGFYGYDLIENLGSERGLRSADRVLPQFQDYRAGDEVPISSFFSLQFYAVETDRYLVWAGLEETSPTVFSWVLLPKGDDRTRLVSRVAWNYHLSDPSSLALEVFTEFGDHIAVRKILQGVKSRVEGEVEPFALQNLELVLYGWAGAGFLAGIILVLARPLGWVTWLTGLLSGFLWLVIWYAPVPLWLGWVIALTELAGLSFVYQTSNNAH